MIAAVCGCVVSLSNPGQKALAADAPVPAAVRGQGASEGTLEKPADLVLLGGKIVTMDDRLPSAADLAVRGDRIAAVGDDAAVRRWIGPNTRVDRVGRPAGHPRLH